MSREVVCGFTTTNVTGFNWRIRLTEIWCSKRPGLVYRVEKKIGIRTELVTE